MPADSDAVRAVATPLDTPWAGIAAERGRGGSRDGTAEIAA
ncbi:hypothetical protein [Microtetraspora malaysiensis]|uniref:Uncharacterized protein n=1 Tax=Microtetraspora malaysiensis TaxID=161358 RepID=A0ABW6SS89_9ACTN